MRSGTPLGRITATGKYGPYAIPTSEVQTVTITGSPTGGTFTLTFSGQTTAAIAYNATAAVVQAALEALSNVDPGDVAVAGGPGPGAPWTVTFAGQYRGENVTQMTASSSLTGGSSPAIAVTTGTGGGSATGSDGTEAFAGLLQYPVSVPDDLTHDVAAVLFWHGRVVESKLPVPVDDAAIASVAGRIVFS